MCYKPSFGRCDEYHWHFIAMLETKHQSFGSEHNDRRFADAIFKCNGLGYSVSFIWIQIYTNFVSCLVIYISIRVGVGIDLGVEKKKLAIA